VDVKVMRNQGDARNQRDLVKQMVACGDCVIKIWPVVLAIICLDRSSYEIDITTK